ncbi:MAG: glycerophosphodiester phosphodiesterase [Candidatus Hodarchaeota archaeon]
MWKRSKIPFIRNQAGRPLIMAHRGNSSEVPENTLEAFKDAHDMGSVDCIETDVHLTKDEEFVFFHDPKVDRTTNAKGRIADFTLAELKDLDAGYKFMNEKSEYPFRGKGFKIQSVKDILPQFKDIKFNMDIKSKDPRAPVLLSKLLDDLDANERVMVGSFHKNQVYKFREVSDIPTSASINEVWQFRKAAKRWIKKHPGETPGKFNQEEIFGEKLAYHALQIPEKLLFLKVILGPAFIQFAHAVDIAVMIWTINERDEMKRLLEWGADGIFTDKPALLIEVMDEMKDQFK